MELNKIYNIDCVKGMKKLADNSIDCIVTSPPYNIGMDYDIYNDSLKWGDYLSWCKEWLSECYRVLKDDGRLCINHYLNLHDKIEKVSRFPLFDLHQIQLDLGFNVHKLCLWEDPTRKKLTAWGSYCSASAPFINTPYEGILVSYKTQWKKRNKGESTISKELFIEGVGGVWKLGTTKGKTKCCFPEKLPEMCIELFTYKGDTVLDIFSGSGTTAKVAKKLGRNYIGFEISKEYCNIANRRIEADAPI